MLLKNKARLRFIIFLRLICTHMGTLVQLQVCGSDTIPTPKKKKTFSPSRSSSFSFLPDLGLKSG